jgi:two-component system nitrogen regulation response regulator GlnG
MSGMSRLLVIDDDPIIRALVNGAFSPPQVHVLTADHGAAGLDLFRKQRPDVVLLDVHLPDATGHDLFQRLRTIDATVPVIFITASADSDLAIEAIKLGCHDYLLKPLNVRALEEQVTHALHVRRMMNVRVQVDAPSEPTKEKERHDAIVGRSPGMQEVYKAIGKAAPHDITVLIRGESGTGKELVARAIYQHSRRSSQQFLAINCAAIPEALLESELFGHEKGAFTGADRRRIGKFEQCHGGTLFLDEIGDMPLNLQAKVLRVLQDRQFQRVGGQETITTDIRLIAATHRDLEAMVAQGQFRGDLFYRLNVFSIRLPSLRERGEDIPRLVDHLLRRWNVELGRDVRSVSNEAMALLQQYPWPGNVREVENTMQSAVLMATGPILLPEHLPETVREPRLTPPAAGGAPQDWEQLIDDDLHAGRSGIYAKALEKMERFLLTRVLQHTNGHQTRAAELLGITRGSLRHKLRALGMQADQVGDGGDDEG